MEYVFILLIVAVVAVLAWTWWSARSERDPASSVDTFSRALSAMQPASSDDRRPGPEQAPDDAADATTSGADADATDDVTTR